MKKINILMCLILFITSIFLLSCSKGDKEEETNSLGLFKSDDFLQVEKESVKNLLGEEIILRGVNAGGYLVTEQWMNAISGDDQFGYYDHKKITDTFTRRFGHEKTLELWAHYRNTYWTDDDFYNCSKMGMNVIRLPFSYMSLDPEFNNVGYIEGEKYNFEILDSFINGAMQYGIYVILDMHGAYGSQNGQDHSGEYADISDIDFYTNEEKMSKTIELWGAISMHYKDNPVVAGYDLLNEPGEKGGLTSKRHWDFLDRVYDKIRANDDRHIIIMEACWDGNHLPRPEEYSWSNVMYSFHNYSGSDDPAVNLASMINKINGVKNMNFKVPFYMGEFNCYGSESSWELTLELFNGLGWHWTSWTYKLNRRDDKAHNGWGIYYTYADLVKPNVDSYDDILRKWSMIDTLHETAKPMVFNSLNTLENVMTKYLNN